MGKIIVIIKGGCVQDVIKKGSHDVVEIHNYDIEGTFEDDRLRPKIVKDKDGEFFLTTW